MAVRETYIATKWKSGKHTQQPNGSPNTTGKGYPHNYEEETNKNTQSETLHKKHRVIIPIFIQNP
jgi:hypothetical protein